MASEVEICNIALQKLGAARITSLTEDSVNARHCNLAYAPMRDLELRSHRWNFARGRVVLAPDSDSPAFGYDYQFTLPADCLRVLLPRDYSCDWIVEGRKILTNQTDTLNLSYIKQVTDPNEFDALFREALACRIANQLCEAITQSNTKKFTVLDEYKTAISLARRLNAFEHVPDDPEESTWEMARL